MQAPLPPIDPKEYSAAYDTLLRWIPTKQDDLHDTIEETQQLLETFRKQREEEKGKEKDMQEIGAMEKELIEFQEKHYIDFQLSQFTRLEKVNCTVCESCDTNISSRNGLGTRPLVTAMTKP